MILVQNIGLQYLSKMDPSQIPAHEGLLELKGQIFWKKYWFSLQGNDLQYFQEDKRLSTRGIIDLSKAQAVRKCGSGSKENMIEIVTKSKTYSLSAPTRHSCDEWVKLLQRGIQFKRRQASISRDNSLQDNDVYEDSMSSPGPKTPISPNNGTKFQFSSQSSPGTTPLSPKPNVAPPKIPETSRPKVTPPTIPQRAPGTKKSENVPPQNGDTYEDVASPKTEPIDTYEDVAALKTEHSEEAEYGEIVDISTPVQMRQSRNVEPEEDNIYGEIEDVSYDETRVVSRIKSMSMEEEYDDAVEVFDDIYGDTLSPNGTTLSAYIDDLYGELEPDVVEELRGSIYADIDDFAPSKKEDVEEVDDAFFQEMYENVLTFEPKPIDIKATNDKVSTNEGPFSSTAFAELKEFLKNNRGQSEMYASVRIKELKGNAVAKLKEYLATLES
ncbi:unnamed protein product [Owenia fusiformis]|uniref:PH domain-containing protein n=1 Tax=Owenia fusiformis TaxID=6347 RepID=A0A8S4PNX1_OWEFU|nr:unnamed protein product [Owenia fusiformis]